MNKLQDYESKLLGAGRSGRVFLVNHQETLIARKIFYSDTIASLIHYFFFGSPNPYVWNEDAIKCAFYRRQILSALIQYWYNGNLRVAEAKITSWNQEFKAYQMDTEFIEGRHVALQQPCNQDRIRELPALIHGVMRPLQKKLIEAGFDGLVWQVGKGTPTALNNFLLASDSSKPVFVWIDLESGVPALFPMNPLALFSFYIPTSIKYGRALFDDVDNIKLKQYVNKYSFQLEENLGSKQYYEILNKIDQLHYHQEKWKNLRRIDCSIQYQLKKGLINEQEARWFLAHPLFWYRKEVSSLLGKMLRKLFIQLPIAIINKIIKIDYIQFLQRFRKFIFFQRYRLQLARNHIATRIQYWQDRKQLNEEEAEILRQSLKREESSAYLNDFAVHIGIKLFIKTLEYLLVPILYVVGLIDEFVFITWLIIGGPVYRQTYTIFRIIQAIINKQEIPWVAFLVGFLPTIGTLAYPCQIVYSSSGKNRKIAQFIIYDFFTMIGAKIPAWGGEDTQTEHFFNRIGAAIARIRVQKNLTP
ncbi:hypothetical protein DSM106972_096140 [Dulcicalothrix desertica PCC 7102]|uniref:Uncharacterized protein n=1 Tax=Dulcicalothrix desertica PCC 7102 TaxID=232991 RepID=A0A433UI20_9CYAN|nr:hypothetical protein [Dulcicalothrix desertica]RUS93465.1 hypothetical protein DSM106972_096140 [Dulcicalothrix desertica PCC 7102]TWH39692.1 hypothetical protein CAL7102_08945 [Dulcicalothrix desertica PCC 7102]